MLLTVEETNDLKTLCKKIGDILETLPNKKRGFIIQYRKGAISIGKSYSTKPYGFRPDYHDPASNNNIPSLVKLVEDHKHLLDNIYGMITHDKPKIKTYNIFYHTNKSINICENRIGNVGINRCRLFDEIIM